MRWSHGSNAFGQRGWNEQPVGMPRRSGGEPGMPVSSRRGPRRAGNERSRPFAVRVQRVAVDVGAAGASSTIRPPYMIAIRSENSTSSDRSWVMNSTEKPSRSRSSTSWPRICRCITTSSAVVGSSMMTTCGSRASAMPIITRWRMPPESWCG